MNQRMSQSMRADTIAVHGGFAKDPAVPICQSISYEFASADEAAALFDLEIDGFRYSCIANPTTAVLDRRIAELEGGVGRSPSPRARPRSIRLCRKLFAAEAWRIIARTKFGDMTR